MFSYRGENQQMDYDFSDQRSPEHDPVDIHLDNKMRQVEESERTRSQFLSKIYGNSLHEQKSHPGLDPSFSIQTCLFVLLGIALVAAVAFLHIKIYRKRRQQIKGTESNEKKYEARANELRRYEEETLALKAPTATFDDDDIVAPTFKLIQPKQAPAPSKHLTGVSTEV